MSDSITDQERAELEELRAERAARAALAPNDGPATPAATELPEDAYDFKVGEVVTTATGFGLVVARAPMSVTTPSGETLPGYRVAAFGPCNDMPATKEDLGLEKL